MTTYPPRHSFSSNEIHDIGTVENNIFMAPESFSSQTSWPSRITLPPFLLRKFVSEIISTFILIFVSCGVGAIHLSDDTRVSQLGASVASGLIVTVMIYAVGHISGAHMNPAVTLAFAVSKHGQFPWIQVPFYWLAQLTGAITSSFVLKALLHPIRNLATTTPSGTPLQALIMEIVVTFIMMFVTSAVATDTRAVGELAGLAVGSAVCINSILAGPVSGGSMNPARSLGPALASKRFDSLWVYFLGPVVGTISGSLAYNFIRFDKPSKCEPPKMSSFKLRRLQSQEAAVTVASDIP